MLDHRRRRRLIPRVNITHIDNDITAWFSKQDPVYQDYERFRTEFGGTRSLIIALKAETPDVLFSAEPRSRSSSTSPPTSSASTPWNASPALPPPRSSKPLQMVSTSETDRRFRSDDRLRTFAVARLVTN